MNLLRDIPFMLGASAVRIGSIWVKARDVETTLARYAHQVFCLSEGFEHYTLRGAASALRYKNKCALFCCRHQYPDFPPDSVMIAEDASGKNLISGSKLVTVTPQRHNEGEEILDVSAMRYDPADYFKPNLKHKFFDAIEDDMWKGSADSHFFLYGYPSKYVNLKYDDEKLQAIDTKKIVTSAKYIAKSAARYVHRIEMTRLTQVDSDGLSGGPVFHLGKDNKGFYIGLAGMILRGSSTSDFLHMVDASFLLRVLKEMERDSL